jgi:hypothetical protein
MFYCLKFMVKQYVVVLLVLLSVFVTAWFGGNRIFWFHSAAYENLYESNTVSLYNESSLTQTFQAKYPGLSRIEIFFRNPGSNLGRVKIHLKQTCQSPSSLVSFDVPESQISADQYYPLDFPPLDDSAGKEYCLVFETAGIATPNELLVHTSHSDIYAGGEAQFVVTEGKNQPNSVIVPVPVSTVTPGKYIIWLPIIQQSRSSNAKNVDIAFQLYYDGPLSGTLSALLDQLTAYKTFLFGQRWFYPLIAGMYVLALVGLLVYVWSREGRTEL